MHPWKRLWLPVSAFVLALTSSSLPAADERMVINEIHYNPDVKTEPVEFVELYNAGTNAVDLAGWYFSDGLNYALPATVVTSGGYVVVAQNPVALQAKFGFAGALGPFNPDGSSALSKFGETITLRNAAGDRVDEVSYKLGFPWPTVGDATVTGNGSSIELIHPSLDNDLGGSWRAAGGGGGTPAQNVTLLSAPSEWRYVKGTNEASSPTTLWREPAFNDATWSAGTLPIGYGETFITTPLSDMRSNYVSVFLRKQFVVSNPGQFTRLVIEAQYDDGFKAWINGVLVVDGSANMPAGEVAFSIPAVSAIENASFVTFNLSQAPASLLVSGTNTIAIQAANSSIGSSSDFFFDARVIGQIGGTSGIGPTPGQQNTVYATNAPPAIRQVEHAPEQPTTGQPVRITAKVTDPHGVGSVSLQYQLVLPGQYIELADTAYTNAANWTTLTMKDDGTSGDVTAGDDVFSVEIPGSVQARRRLIRYRITVTDTLGLSVRVPYADDPQPNFAYFVYDGVPAWRGAVQPGAGGSNGVVFTVSSNEMGRLPGLFLIGRSNTIAQATWFSRYGGDLYQWGGTLVYDGKVYDHIRYRARGGVWRYSMVKNMWKFDMNRGHDFEARDNWGRKYQVPWRKVNLGANIQQGDYWHRGEQGMFESVGSRLFELAGADGFKTAFVTMRVIDDPLEAEPTSQYEGDFWGLYLFIEQEDGRFLEEHGLPDSNFYKMEGGTGELNNLGPNGPTDKSDLNYILQNYNGASEAWWRTNWNLPKYYSYQAIIQAIHHYDINADKNFFYYFNSATRLWEVMPWDFDLTWAHNMYESSWGGLNALASRILGATSEAGTGAQSGTSNLRLNGTRPAFEMAFRNRVREIRDLLFNTNETFRLIDEYATLLRGNPGTNRTMIDADRAQWDYNPKMANSAYTPNLGKAQQGYYYQFPRESGSNVALKGSFEATVQIMKHYVRIRSEHMDALATDAAIPSRPTLTYTGASNYPINRLTFRCSNYSGANPFASMRWRVGEITDTNSPSYRPDEPQKYEIETVWDSGPITTFNSDITLPANVFREGSRYRVRVQFADTTGRKSQWSFPHEFTCGEPENMADLLNYLRITEFMFNPPPDGYEYVELYNASANATLDLAGVKFTQGIDYTFLPGTTLRPGNYLLLIGTTNTAAFRAYYGLDESVAIIAAYSASLNNGGEQVTLRTAAGGTDIVSFNYKDGRGWPPAADGAGHSLVLLDSAVSAQGAGAGDFGGNWRASAYLRGSPGRADVAPPASIVLNEIVAHSDYTNEWDSNDWIELYNPTDSPVPLGPGWYLSDDGAVLTKWMIPSSTVVPARGWVSFDEQTGFHYPTNIGFGLDKDGEQVFLSYLPGTAEDRVVDAVRFKAQENDWSWGRSPDGGPSWYALMPRTRDSANAAPPARMVINELMYHPPDLDGTNDNVLDEFVELFNAGLDPVELFNTNGGWRLDGTVSFYFPTTNVLAPGEYCLVVAFDPTTNAAQLAAFKTLYGMSNDTLRIVGPYGGKLANSSDRVALERPQATGTPGSVAWVIVDEVIYADQSPWACDTDGTGNSLQRIDALLHGSDPANWTGELPTPGAPRAYSGVGLPTIIAQPQDRTVPTNGTVSFSVVACGIPPFTYQWQFNGTNLPGATNATLTRTGVQTTHAGLYTVVVSNPGGSITSEPASLSVQFPPVITAHPVSLTVTAYTRVSFSFAAQGSDPLRYQWRFKGGNLLGETNAALLLTNVQKTQEGAYSGRVENTVGAAVSQEALLTVRVPATITRQPTNLFVPGSNNATFVVLAIGDGTLRYQWRNGGLDIPTATNATFVISNVQLSHSGSFDVVVVNDYGSATSQTVNLTVLVKATITSQPKNQTALQGGTARFSVTGTGTVPIGFRWRRGSGNLTNGFFNGGIVSNPTNSVLTLTNVQARDATNYNVVLTNLAVGTTVSPNAYLTVLADFDGDGMHDLWEVAYGLQTNNAADALLDGDGDRMSNRNEYGAGTDPNDATSYLKIQTLSTEYLMSNLVQITFQAASNRTYGVERRDDPALGNWNRVADVPAPPTNRVITLIDSAPPPGPRRFYRLVIP